MVLKMVTYLRYVDDSVDNDVNGGNEYNGDISDIKRTYKRKILYYFTLFLQP